MIRIIADTTCVLPKELCKELGIVIMPQIIVFGEKSYRDDTELDTQTFLKMLRASSVLPKTAAPPPALYKPYYQEFLDAGDSILVICPSSAVSGTYRSAISAAQDFDSDKIHIIDTRLVGGGLASLVLLAHQWASEGVSIDVILERLEDWRKRERIYFVPDTLEYLEKGGRIGHASALVGSVLQIKPILTMVDGVNEKADSQRTKRRALDRLVQLTIQECPPSEDAHLTIIQSDDLPGAQHLAEEFSKALGIQNIAIYEQCASIVVHVGPGVLSVSYFRP